ncbi:unnamed protein product [Toxocara canis]|uniref:C-type lectin domain-containing protein n=1 Tax=Toxocara canis TaxID=6265 RepID=A0A183V0T7_TOXCA|nr:unnamed protein product [Toxocara canis]
MTKALLFVAFLLCRSVSVAPDSVKIGGVSCTLAVQYVTEDLGDLLNGADDVDLRSEEFLEKLRQIKNEAKEAVAQCAGAIKKDCTIQPNSPHHLFHAVRHEHGAILYTLLSVSSKLIGRSTYYMRRNMCNALCPGTHVVNIHHPSEIETLQQIFKQYNAQVPPADPELRQYNVGFWFQPDGASKWDDGTAYNQEIWPGFPESMPELTEYSCVNLDLETGRLFSLRCGHLEVKEILFSS